MQVKMLTIPLVHLPLKDTDLLQSVTQNICT